MAYSSWKMTFGPKKEYRKNLITKKITKRSVNTLLEMGFKNVKINFNNKKLRKITWKLYFLSKNALLDIKNMY